MKTRVVALAVFAPIALVMAACEAKTPETASAPTEAAAPQQAAPQAAAQPATTLPAAFQGRWDKDAAACANAESTQIVTVRADEVQFFESMARVKTVTEDGPHAVKLEGAFSGEGEEWEGKMRLEITADDKLKVDEDSAGLLVRCPAN